VKMRYIKKEDSSSGKDLMAREIISYMQVRG
jgi:hypothetical protein